MTVLVNKQIPMCSDLLSKFWARCKKGSPSECWMWTGVIYSTGYGMMYFRGGRYSPHRIACEIKHGPIPQGMFACHKCDTPACVNPDHLFVGTPTDNVHDAMAKGRTRSGMAVHPDLAAKGERVGGAKLKEGDVLVIRREIAAGKPLREIAAHYGVTRENISCIKRGDTWAWLRDSA